MFTAACATKKISMTKEVFGVTSVDDELFVLLSGKVKLYHLFNKPIAVYSITDYQLLRHLKLPRYKPDVLCDMTSCVLQRCLYMSDFDKGCVHRYALANGARNRWPVSGKPCGLSVTPSGNLLVTCHCAPNKLVELSVDDGQCVREIALHIDITSPCHSVQLTTGQFVVCHGLRSIGPHRVCLVGDCGKVTRSYGSQRGSEIGHLDDPCHLAVDKDSQSIFVADSGNHRVVLLSPTLEFVRFAREGLPNPHRLHFHQATRRLFVGQEDDGFTVLQL